MSGFRVGFEGLGLGVRVAVGVEGLWLGRMETCTLEASGPRS